MKSTNGRIRLSHQTTNWWTTEHKQQRHVSCLNKNKKKTFVQIPGNVLPPGLRKSSGLYKSINPLVSVDYKFRPLHYCIGSEHATFYIASQTLCNLHTYWDWTEYVTFWIELKPKNLYCFYTLWLRALA